MGLGIGGAEGSVPGSVSAVAMALPSCAWSSCSSEKFLIIPPVRGVPGSSNDLKIAIFLSAGYSKLSKF